MAGVVCAILAGGASSRMSVPKASIVLGGRSIVRWELDAVSAVFDDIMLVCKGASCPDASGVRVVTDDPEFADRLGPMTGIYTALGAADGRSVFALGCDMPFVRPELVRMMAALADGVRAVVPVVGGWYEPLFAIYPPAAREVARGLIGSGEMKLSGLLGGLDVIELHEDELRRYDPELVSFTNVNTPAQLESARPVAERLSPDGPGEARRGLQTSRK